MSQFWRRATGRVESEWKSILQFHRYAVLLTLVSPVFFNGVLIYVDEGLKTTEVGE